MEKSFLPTLLCAAMFVTCAFAAAADDAAEPDVKRYLPQIHGTIRAKYEYEPTIGKSRFEIITVR